MNGAIASPARLRGATQPYSTAARRAYVVLAALLVVIHAVAALSGQSSGPITDWLYCAGYLLAAAACANRGRTGDARAAWAFAAVGVLIWGVSEITYRVLRSDPTSWYPPLSQATLFIAFSLAYMTLVLLARERVRRVRPGAGARRSARPASPPRRWRRCCCSRVLGVARCTRHAAAGLPARRAGRSDVRRHRARDDRLAAGAGVGADRDRDHRQRDRRRRARAPRPTTAASIAARPRTRCSSRSALLLGLAAFYPSRPRAGVAQTRPAGCPRR